jgi:N-acetylgalactosamine-6-sulfatase
VKRFFALFGVLLVASFAHAAAPSRPNIVILLADDMGYRDIGCFGVKDIRTPAIDALAARGVKFTHFYANGQECSPTRTALMTGRYQQRVGGLECAIGTGNVGRYDDAIRLANAHDLGLPVSETSVARMLKDAGYATAIIGKWHLGYEDKFGPNRHGFDYALYCQGGGMDYFHHVEDPPAYAHVLRLNGKDEKRDGYFTDIIADEAERYIAANRERPFFLYVPFTAPHAPFQGPDEKQPNPLPADSLRWDQGKAPAAVYAAMVERLDQSVGRIVTALEQNGVARRTLVIFMSDNGGTKSARPSGLREFKGTTFEGGIRVPCIARWPGVLPENVTTAQAAITMDLTASIVRAAGAKVPAGRTFDGIDVLALIAERKPEVSRTLFWRGRRGDSTWRSVRDGSLKYVYRTVDGATTVEGLFDLKTDEGEKNDLRATRPEDVARLRGLLAAWEKQVAPVR